MGYHAQVETITPAKAKSLLARNYENNRKIREGYVAQLAEVMSQGRFESENGQTIVVGDDDGILYDAQHRLEAIVRSGTTHRFIVAYIVEGKEKFTTIDSNTPRKAADFLDMPNAKLCAAIGKVMACIEWGEAPFASCLSGTWSNVPHTKVDRGMIVLYCNQNTEEVSKAARLGSLIRRSLRCGQPTAYGLFITLVDYLYDDNDVLEFIDDLSNDTPSDITVAACKNRIMRAFLASTKPDTKWLLGLLLDAYHHYTAHDGATMLNKGTTRLNDVGRMVTARRSSN